MKHFLFAAAVAVSVVLASCSLTESSQYSPRVTAGTIVCSHADTVWNDTLRAIPREGIYRIDTIHVGDTVRFPVAVMSYTNHLVRFSVVYDTLALALQIDSVELLQEGLDMDLSQPERGKLEFKSGYNYAAFPIRYIPLKAGAPEIQLLVESDSKYPKSVLQMTQPVAEPPVRVQPETAE